MPRSGRLIARQLKKAGLAVGGHSPEMNAFLDLVTESYSEFEKHRQLTEHSTRLASEELAESLASLRTSERMFRALARCSPNGIIQSDIEGQTIYANERAQQLAGRSAEELVGRGWLQAIHPDDRALFYTTRDHLQADPELVRCIEHRIVAGEGDIVWVSSIVAPLVDADGNHVGWISNVEDMTDRKQHEEELSALARHDSLTQLLNRHALRQRLDEIAASRTAQSRMAIALIDLDRFKMVNDTFGHAVGDRLLVTVADRLRSSVGADDVVARLGGDEFAVATMLDPSATPGDLGKLLSDALHGPVDLGSRTVHLRSSVGVAVAEGKRGTPSSLLRDADTAMYRAKRSAIHRYEVFDEIYREEVTRRLVMESELREAILADDIELEFQPVFDSANGKVFTVAAVPHLQSNILGQVAHTEFATVAEDLGLSGILSERLLDRACAVLGAWHRDVPTLRGLTVSCKIAAEQLADPAFPGSVRRMLALNGLSGTALILEVSETSILRDLECTTLTLDALRSLGVSVAIDDFGAEYSALSYFDRLSMDFLKIDKSFIELMGEGEEYESANRLAGALISLAFRFGLTPVAEGVQTEEQGALLRRAGCQLSQGPHLAEPMLADDPRLIEVLKVNRAAEAKRR